MAVVTGYDRTDEKYLKFLEDEFCRRKMEDERKVKSEQGAGGVTGDPALASAVSDIKQSLQRIADRVDSLEDKVPTTGSGGDIDAAADILTAPLTRALSKLTIGEEEAGRQLRPEWYAQSSLKEKGRDHTKMDYVDLFFGWICVAEYLIKSRGDLPSYIRHLKFASGMLQSRQFYDMAAIKYDRYIVDHFLEGKASSFDPDPVASSLTFSSRVIPDHIELCHGASLTKGVRSYPVNKQPKKHKPGSYQRQNEVPIDFPSDICFFFN